MNCPPVRHNGKRSYATTEGALDAATTFGEYYGRRYTPYWCAPERMPDGCGMWHLRDASKRTAKRSARIKEIRETDPERYRVKKSARRKQWRQNRRQRDREAGTDPTSRDPHPSPTPGGDHMSENVAMNTDPAIVRCGMCGGRCLHGGAGFPRWIYCDPCSWSSHDPRRVGWLWRLRVLIGR